MNIPQLRRASSRSFFFFFFSVHSPAPTNRRQRRGDVIDAVMISPRDGARALNYSNGGQAVSAGTARRI